MDDFRILLTGDYWHRDFAGVISGLKFPITLQPLESVVSSPLKTSDYRLVLIAQPRRGQFEVGLVEQLQNRFAHLPIVSLEGSWCEGESRSGSPIPGLIHIYWHQWQGRLDNFLYRLNRHEQPSWHLPKICSLPDRIVHDLEWEPVRVEFDAVVGISSLTADGFGMLRDAFERTGQRTIWIDHPDSGNGRPTTPTVLLIEGNSLSAELEKRIRILHAQFRHSPLILILNFPRSHEFELARKLGVAAIVSKPYELGNLYSAVQRAILNAAA